MNRAIFRAVGSATCFILLSTSVYAGNTSGIHGPGVKADDRSAQLRLALSPSDDSDGEDNWAYRLHYQHSFNDRFRVRLVTQFRDRGSFEYDFARTEFLYQFLKASPQSNWSSGVRFEVRTRRGSRAEDIALHWTNQWDLDDGWRARGILITGTQFGSNKSSSSMTLGSRFGMTKKLDNIRVGFEMFSGYGSISDIGSFDEQSHQLGPMIAGKLGGFDVEFRYLAGLTDSTRDHDFGLRFNKKF